MIDMYIAIQDHIIDDLSCKLQFTLLVNLPIVHWASILFTELIFVGALGAGDEKRSREAATVAVCDVDLIADSELALKFLSCIPDHDTQG